VSVSYATAGLGVDEVELPIAIVGGLEADDAIDTIKATVRQYHFRYRSPAHFIEVFRTWYGPMHKAFAALPSEGAEALERDLAELLQSANVSDHGVLKAPSDYLEVVITKA